MHEVWPAAPTRSLPPEREREFVIDDQLVRIHSITRMIQRTSLAPWVCEFTFSGSIRSIFPRLPPETPPKPEEQNPKPKLKPEAQNPKPKTLNSKPRPVHELGICPLGSPFTSSPGQKAKQHASNKNFTVSR